MSRDVDELEALAREGRLQGLPGIRKKTEENILRGIEMLKRGKERQPLGKVLPVAEDIIEKLRGVSGIKETPPCRKPQAVEGDHKGY